MLRTRSFKDRSYLPKELREKEEDWDSFKMFKKHYEKIRGVKLIRISKIMFGKLRPQKSLEEICEFFIDF